MSTVLTLLLKCTLVIYLEKSLSLSVNYTSVDPPFSNSSITESLGLTDTRTLGASRSVARGNPLPRPSDCKVAASGGSNESLRNTRLTAEGRVGRAEEGLLSSLCPSLQEVVLGKGEEPKAESALS